jgi:hypothetical protein
LLRRILCKKITAAFNGGRLSHYAGVMLLALQDTPAENAYGFAF